jgi:hypothetical protein
MANQNRLTQECANDLHEICSQRRNSCACSCHPKPELTEDFEAEQNLED